MRTVVAPNTVSDVTRAEPGVARGADAGAWCNELWPYLGRPIALVGFTAGSDPEGRSLVEVTVRIHRADRQSWQDHRARAADADPTVATGRAVLQAVRGADPVAVMLWDLDRQGHLIAAVVQDGSGERPTIGPDAEVERLHRFRRTVPTPGQIGVRTARAAYRAVCGPGLRLALATVDEPGATAAVDQQIASLPPHLARSGS
jgi:hypothetical protein